MRDALARSVMLRICTGIEKEGMVREKDMSKDEKNTEAGTSPVSRTAEEAAENSRMELEFEETFSGYQGFSDHMFEDEVSAAAEAALSAVKRDDDRADTLPEEEKNRMSAPTPSSEPDAGGAENEEEGGPDNAELSSSAAAQVSRLFADAEKEAAEAERKEMRRKNGWFSGLLGSLKKREDRSMDGEAPGWDEDLPDGSGEEAEEERATRGSVSWDDEDWDDEGWEDENREPLLHFSNISLPRLSGKQKKRLITGLFAVVLLAGVLVAVYAIVHREYEHYHVLYTRRQEDTLSASYCRVGENILRYGMDGATLTRVTGDVIWDADYTMKTPEVDVFGQKILIYDKSGTSIVVCGEKGKEDAFDTSYPVIRAKLTAKGSVAALMENSENTYIEYYKTDGTIIATIKSSMENPGYPMDFAISPNGQMIAVSYLAYGSSGQQSVVDFYNFGSAGQDKRDNNVSSFEYPGTIIPQLDYISDTTCVAYGDNCWMLYTGTSSMKELATEKIEAEVRSVISDDRHFGIITGNNAGPGYHISLYDTTGRKKLEREFDFDFREAEIVGDEISFYNGASFYMMTTSGIDKYDGAYQGSVQNIFSMGDMKYIVVAENTVEELELK